LTYNHKPITIPVSTTYNQNLVVDLTVTPIDKWNITVNFSQGGDG
jgi:hypothetical protein